MIANLETRAFLVGERAGDGAAKILELVAQIVQKQAQLLLGIFELVQHTIRPPAE